MAEITVVEGLVIHPGDRLIVRMERTTTPAEVVEFKAQFRERLPDVDLTIIAADQIAVCCCGGRHG